MYKVQMSLDTDTAFALISGSISGNHLMVLNAPCALWGPSKMLKYILFAVSQHWYLYGNEYYGSQLALMHGKLKMMYKKEKFLFFFFAYLMFILHMYV